MSRADDAGVRAWRWLSDVASRVSRWASHRSTERYFRNVTGDRLPKWTRSAPQDWLGRAIEDELLP